jgi:hypothetical protein
VAKWERGKKKEQRRLTSKFPALRAALSLLPPSLPAREQPPPVQNHDFLDRMMINGFYTRRKRTVVK